MKTIILSGVLAGSVMLNGCNTTEPTTTTTTTTQTTKAATVGTERGVRIINGQRYVFVRPELGSNIAGHWVLENSAEARRASGAGTLDRDTIQRTQDSQAKVWTRAARKPSR